jgi:exosortase/archaeosortase family protein
MKRPARKSNAVAVAPVGSAFLKPWRAWLSAHRSALAFVGRFALWVAGLTALSFTPPLRLLLRGYLNATAQMAGGLLVWFGLENHVNGATVWSAQYALTVAEDCSASELMLFFFSAVLAFPIPTRRKWPGLVAGALIIPLMNLLRVASLFAVGVYWPGSMEFIHLEIMPLGLIVITLVGWLTWLHWASRGGVLHPHAA